MCTPIHILATQGRGHQRSFALYPFGLIGNCSYLAYIDTAANVVWQCLPRFDSSFIFGGLIDPEKGGRFSISPQNGEKAQIQSYMDSPDAGLWEFRNKQEPGRGGN